MPSAGMVGSEHSFAVPQYALRRGDGLIESADSEGGASKDASRVQGGRMVCAEDPFYVCQGLLSQRYGFGSAICGGIGTCEIHP